jgi:hypothetical protein
MPTGFWRTTGEIRVVQHIRERCFEAHPQPVPIKPEGQRRSYWTKVSVDTFASVSEISLLHEIRWPTSLHCGIVREASDIRSFADVVNSRAVNHGRKISGAG